MAEEKWKQGIRENWSAITSSLGNPEELLEYLYHKVSPPLINEDQFREIKSMDGTRKAKTRKLLTALMYGDERVLTQLVIALRATKNETLANLLHPHVNDLRKKLHLPPEEWPPTQEVLEEMHNAEVEPTELTKTLLEEYMNYDEVYTMTAKTRGLAVIINNVEFDKKCHNERKGSDLDRDKLSRVLCQLHFSVKIYNNLNSADMLRIAEESSHWEGHRNSNCCVFTILTHGCQQGVYGTDGGVVRVNDIVKNFNSINCPELKGKPKIFLFQSCRNSEDEKQNKSEGPKPNSTGVSPEDMEEEEDTSKAFDNVPNDLVVEDSAVAEGPKHKIQRQPSESHEHSDFFFGYATPEGFRSYRQEKRGSWFIQAIVWVLKYNSHQEHILDLMTKVNRYVSTATYRKKGIQVSETRGTLRKRLYFFPGIYNKTPEKNIFIGRVESFEGKQNT